MPGLFRRPPQPQLRRFPPPASAEAPVGAIPEETVTGTVTTGDTVTTDSWTPGSNELILVSVYLLDEAITPTVAGNGLTFVSEQDVTNTQSVGRMVVFRAMGASPSTGAITVTITGNATPCGVIATRFSGTDTSGTNGSGACEASTSAPGPGTDDDDMLLAVTTVTPNALAWGAGGYRNRTFTVPGGQNIIFDDLLTGGTAGQETNSSTWYVGPVVSPESTTLGAANDLSAATDWVMVAISIKPSGGGGTLVEVTATDSLGFADSPVRVGTFLRTMADSLTAGNTVARLGTFGRTASDSLSLGNTVVRLLTLGRTAADALSLGNTVARIGTFGRTLADTLSLGDTVTRLGTFLRNATDSLTFSEVVAGAKLFVRTLADSLGIGDAVVRVGTFGRTASDGLSLGDTVARVGTFVRSAADGLGIGDAVTRIGTFARTAADSLGFSDLVEAIKSGGVTIVRTVADTISIMDNVVRSGAFTRAASDALDIAQSVVAQLAAPVVGGLAPVGRAFASAISAAAGHLRPGGSAHGDTPAGKAEHPKPKD